MRIQSALGEPLQAQLSLGALTTEEINTITVGFAAATDYEAAGIIPNVLLNNVQISIDKSIASNVVINMTSTSAMSDPFLDMLLEIKWASGKVVRDYTLLFTSSPSPSPSPSPSLSTDAVIVDTPSVSNPTVALPVESSAASNVAQGEVLDAASPTPQPEPVTQIPEAIAEEVKPTANQRIRVVRGDTASRLASANMPEGVSLDQMLQAMLRANPNAFVNNNVNRLKAGVSLTVPDAEAAQSIDPGEARRLVVAQSRDFNAYRRSLAANAPTQSVAPAGQIASGQIEAQVQDKAAAEPTADQLTLSQGSVASGTDVEERIAATKQAQDEQARQADLTRNIDELKALATSTASAGGDGDTASLTVTSAPVVTAASAPTTPLAQPDNATPDSAIQRLIAQPWTLPMAFGLLVLLVVLVITRLTRREKPRASSEETIAAPVLASNDQRITDAPASGLTAFNLDDIDLNLSPIEAPGETEGTNSEALVTKFELAKEFLSLGDRVAAKALAEEVQADATGMLKRRAEMFLNELG